jgi:hypothetical protein
MPSRGRAVKPSSALPRLLCSVLLVGAALTVSSCGDRTATGPAQVGAAGPQASLIGDIIKVFTRGLIDSCASLSSEPVTRTIGPDGGVIAIGPDTLRIPPRALSRPVTIQASLPAGYFVNFVVFEPSGLTFRKPASLTMGYSSCNLLANLGLEIAQVTDDLRVIEYLRSTDNKATRSVTGVVQHFSNYAVAY